MTSPGWRAVNRRNHCIDESQGGLRLVRSQAFDAPSSLVGCLDTMLSFDHCDRCETGDDHDESPIACSMSSSGLVEEVGKKPEEYKRGYS